MVICLIDLNLTIFIEEEKKKKVEREHLKRHSKSKCVMTETRRINKDKKEKHRRRDREDKRVKGNKEDKEKRNKKSKKSKHNEKDEEAEDYQEIAQMKSDYKNEREMNRMKKLESQIRKSEDPLEKINNMFLITSKNNDSDTISDKSKEESKNNSDKDFIGPKPLP